MPDSALMMFSICSNIRWSHLPNAGGLYDQDPDFIRKIMYIFGEQGKFEKAKAVKEKREQERGMGRSGPLAKPSRSY